MDKYVITISRQFGALGRTIAQKMAAELGIEFYDRDIVEHTAKRMGLPVSEISKEEERAGGFFAERRYPLGMGPVSMQEELFQVQTNIIRDFASKESCIIVGRCGEIWSVCLIYMYMRRLRKGLKIAFQYWGWMKKLQGE